MAQPQPLPAPKRFSAPVVYAHLLPEGYVYQQPIMRPVTPWSIDPWRLRFWNEYPRTVPPVEAAQPMIEREQLADFEVRVVATRDRCHTLTAELWLLPSPHRLRDRGKIKVGELRHMESISGDAIQTLVRAWQTFLTHGDGRLAALYAPARTAGMLDPG